MTVDIFADDDDGNTPLTPEERAALIPSYIALRSELNKVEQIGITEAESWAFSRNRDILTEAFLKELHRRMFRQVWRWAGEIRQSERNIGVDHWMIGVELHQLLDDVRFWIEHETYSPDEIAIRFHHRLVFIHPFPNGNGRHARLAADLLIDQLGGERFTWGRTNLVESGETRKRYIDALRAADAHDIGPLLEFARS
jgi:Fic-DOC domain mobile mystery protein B